MSSSSQPGTAPTFLSTAGRVLYLGSTIPSHCEIRFTDAEIWSKNTLKYYRCTIHIQHTLCILYIHVHVHVSVVHTSMCLCKACSTHHGLQVSESSHQVVLLAGLQNVAHAGHQGLGSVPQNDILAYQNIACPVCWMAVATAVMYHLQTDEGHNNITH